MSHTPGPWVAAAKTEKQHTRIEQCSARGDGQWHITVAWINDDVNTVPDADGRLGETWKANARLIAAAPELLEALREIHGFLKSLLDSHDDEAVDLLTNYGDGVEETARSAIAKAEGRS